MPANVSIAVNHTHHVRHTVSLQSVSVRCLAALAVTTVVMMTLHSAIAAPVNVRFPEGVSQGFLVLRSLDGEKRADGELRQTSVERRTPREPAGLSLSRWLPSR